MCIGIEEHDILFPSFFIVFFCLPQVSIRTSTFVEQARSSCFLNVGECRGGEFSVWSCSPDATTGENRELASVVHTTCILSQRWSERAGAGAEYRTFLWQRHTQREYKDGRRHPIYIDLVRILKRSAPTS